MSACHHSCNPSSEEHSVVLVTESPHFVHGKHKRLVRMVGLDHTQHVTDCLARLQDSIISSPECSSPAINEALAALTAGLHQLLAAQAKGSQEHQLRADLASKEAECARLQSEIARLRRNVQRLEGVQAQASSSGQQQLQLDEQTVPDRTDRQAVLSAAVPAKDGPHADVHALQSELQAHLEHISKLESELQAQAHESSMRLSQLQDSFVAKTAEMRQAYQQALQRAAAAHEASQAESQEQVEQQRQEWQRAEQQLRQEVQRLQAQQAADQTMVQELQLKLMHAQQQQQQQLQQTPSSSIAGAVPQLLPTAPATLAPIAPAASTSTPLSNADTALVALMEGQLMRLSGIIRTHEAEIATLRQAVQAGCEERRQLQQQHDAALRQAQGPGAAVAAGGTGKGVKGAGGQARAVQLKSGVQGAGQLSHAGGIRSAAHTQAGGGNRHAATQ